MLNRFYNLQFSITKTGFTIIDDVSGESIIYENNKYITGKLDKQVVLQRISLLLESYAKAKRKKSWKELTNSMVTANDVICIKEASPCGYLFVLNGATARLKDGVLLATAAFDADEVNRRLLLMQHTISVEEYPLNPTKNIVRRIADVGLLVWVYHDCSVVVFEKNVRGCIMDECLINGVYYKRLYVDVCDENNTCTIYDHQFNSVIQLPVDESIKHYYKSTEDIFSDFNNSKGA